MRSQDIDQNNWTVDNLNKAYRKGYLFGLSGEGKHNCPFSSEVIAAAWEAGWSDGCLEASRIGSPDLEQAIA